ncbi:MAG: bifunctional indole-3-glycerol phosphate synthase/phosphoribosylanthranilate isomerase [Treponema sp.]|nr:bifunctional indole-3-glycerol phosphate synthase/phosphoribosylanthranilate isomerase [Candidatus Treponema equi]
MNILDEIVQQRKKDIAERGMEMGFDIPAERTRPVVPFLPGKGVILEVKRASPSKGDIAPSLDSAATGLAYVNAGAAAISVLTEEHWFKGTLEDLKKVTAAVGTKAAVLRKDFLIHEDEIDIAYRCGADAVLLIARILDDERIVAMAKRCQDLGITALVELKMEDDLRKLALVAKAVKSDSVVCGVNCRDLKNFSIDLLGPSGVLEDIKAIMGPEVRVVFESGIRTPEAADFAGSLGFTGMLLGEAAARNPDEAKCLVESFVNAKETRHSRFYTELAVKIHKNRLESKSRPLVKICGITSIGDAKLAAETGADYLGFIFCSKSPRNVSEKIHDFADRIPSLKKKHEVKTVCIITETDSPEAKTALELAEKGIFDAVQVHGYNTALAFLSQEKLRHMPHWCAVAVGTEDDLAKLEQLRKLGEPRILVDAKLEGFLGGTGTKVEESIAAKIASKQKLWLAGGLNPDNIGSTIATLNPELVDLSSGLEMEPGKKDPEKLKAFQKIMMEEK